MNGTHLNESEVHFRNQFNPQHPSFHSGDPTPVPVGGSRVPEGCTEVRGRRIGGDKMQPPFSLSPEDPLQLPEEYLHLLEERQFIGKMKGEIGTAAKLVGQLFQKQGCKITPDELKDSLKSIEVTFAESHTILSSSTEEVEACVKKTLELCKEIPENKESYGDFLFGIKRITNTLFNEQARLLKEMKRIKQTVVSAKK